MSYRYTNFRVRGLIIVSTPSQHNGERVDMARRRNAVMVPLCSGGLDYFSD